VNRSVLSGGAVAATGGADVMKDNDLREKFYLQQREAEELRHQLSADSKFLLEHNLMDYSLLVGIQKEVTYQPLAHGREGGDGQVRGYDAAATLPVAKKYHLHAIIVMNRALAEIV
jgi:hypothetical protein